MHESSIKQRSFSLLLILFLLSSDLSFAVSRRTKVGSPYFKHTTSLVSGLALIGTVSIVTGLFLKTFFWGPQSDLQILDQRYQELAAQSGIMILRATAILRFPHMLSELMDQEDARKNKRSKVLILGAGEQGTKGRPESPFIHELAAVFPTADLEIVDLDPRVVDAVENGAYGDFFKKNAQKVVENPENFSRFKDAKGKKKAKHSQQKLKKLVARIPLKLSEHTGLKIKVETTYFEVHKPQKYDYIIATKSLIYPLHSDGLSPLQKDEMIAKYLEALNENGRLYIDFQTYEVFFKEYFVVNNIVDFKQHIILHNAPYKGARVCPEDAAGYDFIACTTSVDGQRIAATEDVVVLTRKL